ncbi:MAG: hypothetical protein JST12_16855 [Armatimonadetes bacterium]|nr:hypothetical protein [Armatimonadota bacterium]
MWLSVRRFVMYALPLILLAVVVMLPIGLRPKGLVSGADLLAWTLASFLLCVLGYRIEVRKVPVDLSRYGSMMLCGAIPMLYATFSKGILAYQVVGAVWILSLVPVATLCLMAGCQWVQRKMGVRNAV